MRSRKARQPAGAALVWFLHGFLSRSRLPPPLPHRPPPRRRSPTVRLPYRPLDFNLPSRFAVHLFFLRVLFSLSLSLFLSLPPQRPSCMLLLWIGSLRLRGRKYGANAGGSERSEVAPMKGTPRRRYRDLEHTNTQNFFFTAAVAAIALASRPCPWPSPWRRAAPTCASSPSPPPPSPASSSGTAPGSPGTWPCRCRGTS